MDMKEMKSRLFRENPKFAIADHCANLIKNARLSAGLTQTQLAKKLGTKQECIARWEARKHEPSISTLQRIAEATGKKLKYPRFS
jgi:ribosome-binding protein aMBF1 (putative translation factor)